MVKNICLLCSATVYVSLDTIVRHFTDSGETDNSGIYAILAQFAIISLVTGILSFAAPSSMSHVCDSAAFADPRSAAVVAVSIPSFGSYILGAVCILVAAFQIVGFLGVYREKPGLFKT